MISIDLAAGIFAAMIGLVLTACVITCIIAQQTLQQCREILASAVDYLLKAHNKEQEDFNHEGTE